uniref:Tic22-like family protein n=1 Tax=Amphora coffeiformis TaxID=265554 RepID=A0A7S3LAY4_9STRA|mmetsp:Transcript_18339/g.36925  ORF Transcript_18339/g.36925 Transcript_18339/m.36925 type:complete len:355 (+) Transcript_18339:113-1177(+)
MMMMKLSTRILFLLSCISVAASTTSSFATRGIAGVSPHGSLFGVPRGGGLFGGKDEKKAVEESTSDEGKTMYPAMTKEEIEEWLEHVPVFAVTDSNGAGVVLRPENDTSVFYFFLNPMQANATLTQLKSVNPDMDLKVSAFSLGKIWFNLLQGKDGQEVVLKSPGAEDESTKDVEYRLVPDTRDLLGARMLLTMSPEDGEKLKEAGGMTPEMAQAAIKKAMEESPKFKQTFNEIPVFTIAQMRMQKQPAEGETGEPVTLLPMYFSMQNMVATWQEFMKSAPPEVQGVEPAINLMSLHDLVDMMQKESEIDWRHVVLVPLASGMGGGESDVTAGASTATAADPMAQMGGATLGDD